MKLHVYSLKNRLSGFYERAFCEPYAPDDYAQFLQQSLATATIEDLLRHKEYDVYCLGIFDNKEGTIVPASEFVMSLDSLCNAYILLKEKKEDIDEQSKTA